MTETQQNFPCVVDAGDSGMMVLFGDTLSLQVNNAAHAFDHALRERKWPGVEELAPAIRGVLVRYDPLLLERNRLRNKIETLLGQRDWMQAGPDPERRLWRLPAHYGDASGPDLDNVANQLGQTTSEVIRIHSRCRCRVLMLGFAPGCAYLGSLPEEWDLPRLDYVKPDVPPGSLSVAVRQTVLFATPIPTGWQTIARTPFLSFSRQREPYFFLAPGDEVEFEPIDATEFTRLFAESTAGKMIVTPSTCDDAAP